MYIYIYKPMPYCHTWSVGDSDLSATGFYCAFGLQYLGLGFLPLLWRFLQARMGKSKTLRVIRGRCRTPWWNRTRTSSLVEAHPTLERSPTGGAERSGSLGRCIANPPFFTHSTSKKPLHRFAKPCFKCPLGTSSITLAHAHANTYDDSKTGFYCCFCK